MSGFVVIWQRDQTPVDGDLLAKMLRVLDDVGHDGKRCWVSAEIGIGTQQFYTTSQAQGEQQPILSQNQEIAVVFEGRLDNRHELMRQLGTPRSLSDTHLLLAAYDKWGDRLAEQLLGAFALVIFDKMQQKLVCARDALGDRTLFFAHTRNAVLLASEERALLAHPALTTELNENTLRHFFAWRTLADGSTFFKNVCELPPAHTRIFWVDGDRSWQHWQFIPSRAFDGQTDAQFAEQFAALLNTSVRCRLPSTTPVGIKMSGGLDSTSIAGTSRRVRPDDDLHTFSWVFDEVKQGDESDFIGDMNAFCRLTGHQVAGDGLYPLFSAENWPLSPNQPFSDPYEGMSIALYKAASHVGIRPMLTGLFADDLYGGLENWLADLVSERRLLEAGREFLTTGRRLGFRSELISKSVKSLAKRPLENLSTWQRLRPQRLSTPTWLNDRALVNLSGAQHLIPQQPPTTRRRWQFYSTLKTANARTATAKHTMALQHKIELRHPYRDRRLVEWMLNIPAHQFYHRSWGKLIVRNAMKNTLPDSVRLRKKVTTLRPLFLRGVAERQLDQFAALLHHPNAIWPNFIRPNFIPATREGLRTTLTQAGNLESIVMWSCAMVELWRQRFGY